MPNNSLTLAVAGSRKTQGIVDSCRNSPAGERILILTYTTTNQTELRRRLETQVGDHLNIEVMGWFTFLIRHIVRPFVPFVFSHRRVMGFDYDSPPRTRVANTNEWRYFDSKGRVCRVHLPQLALMVEEASGGAALRRLNCLYDKIYIDEVQDLCGYDLEILSLLMASPVTLEMVGDVRQAVLATNARERMNKPYMYMGIWNWFKKQQRAGSLIITQSNVTWRCHPEIVRFADSLFGVEWGFDSTVSVNENTTSHDGLFLVRTSDVERYVAEFRPLCLRYSVSSGRHLDLDFMNYKASKGMSTQRVLIHPTAKVKKLLQYGSALEQMSAAELYVAITRAEQSVAFILDDPGSSEIPYWSSRS